MSITEICTQADKNSGNLAKLNELWNFLKANNKRFSTVEFEFAAEHIGNYVEKIENEMEASEKLKKIDDV